MIQESGAFRLYELKKERQAKEDQQKYQELLEKVNKQNIRTAKAARKAHKDTVKHNPKVRNLMFVTICIAGLSFGATVVSLINAITNQRVQKSTQEKLQQALEQQQLQDSSIQSLVKTNDRLFDLILKGSEKGK